MINHKILICLLLYVGDGHSFIQPVLPPATESAIRTAVQDWPKLFFNWFVPPSPQRSTLDASKASVSPWQQKVDSMKAEMTSSSDSTGYLSGLIRYHPWLLPPQTAPPAPGFLPFAPPMLPNNPFILPPINIGGVPSLAVGGGAPAARTPLAVTGGPLPERSPLAVGGGPLPIAPQVTIVPPQPTQVTVPQPAQIAVPQPAQVTFAPPPPPGLMMNPILSFHGIPLIPPPLFNFPWFGIPSPFSQPAPFSPQAAPSFPVPPLFAP